MGRVSCLNYAPAKNVHKKDYNIYMIYMLNHALG